MYRKCIKPATPYTIGCQRKCSNANYTRSYPSPRLSSPRLSPQLPSTPCIVRVTNAKVRRGHCRRERRRRRHEPRIRARREQHAHARGHHDERAHCRFVHSALLRSDRCSWLCVVLLPRVPLRVPLRMPVWYPLECALSTCRGCIACRPLPPSACLTFYRPACPQVFEDFPTYLSGVYRHVAGAPII